MQLKLQNELQREAKQYAKMIEQTEEELENVEAELELAHRKHLEVLSQKERILKQRQDLDKL